MRFDARIKASACRLIVQVYALVPALVAGCLFACTPQSETPVQAAESRVGTDAEIAAVQSWLADTSQTNAVEPTVRTLPADTSAPPVEDMIAGLEARLLASPNDLKGWSLLAQAYAHVGRMGDARNAIDRAVALGAHRERLETRVHRAHVGPT